MNANVTRTTNPLPFQDLEPKRFEDLVRQIAYDFRPWRRLEATGRSGSDEGFDARALEIVDSPIQTAANEDEVEDEVSQQSFDRLWLIQCKREKTIGPTKAENYLNEIVLLAEQPLHGLIFAAACDFSKKTRDVILSWCREKGISEVYVWGKGELEDMLFQPKNDNLLFAYFGISLAIRQRTTATRLRAELAVKRKLKKTVATSSAEILVRDPEAPEYPNVQSGKRPTKWWVYQPEELSYLGLMLSIRWHYAYIDRETGEWDVADAVTAMRPYHPWRVEDESIEELEAEAGAAWNSLPDKNKGWLKISGSIPYSSIIAIDEMGDDVFEGVHVYVKFNLEDGPFDSQWKRFGSTSAYESDFQMTMEKRMKKFDEKLRLKD